MYTIVKYKNQIKKQDAETRKRYELIEKLSSGFKVKNDKALELDKLLTEQMEIEVTDNTNPDMTFQSENSDSSSVDNLFAEMYEVFKVQAIPQEAISKAVEERLSKVKIGIQHLDDSLKQKLSSSPLVIRYDLPGVSSTAFKKPAIESFQYIVDDMLMGNNVFLVGGAGTGKTYMAEILLSKMALNRSHITINCSQWTAPTEIIGGQTMDGYVEGKLIEAWVKGHVLILDELPKIDPNTAGLFNDALAKTKIVGAVIFNSRREQFAKHKDFACIATGNIYPSNESVTYGANNKQDLSLLDRFSGSVYFIEKNPTIEREILQNDMIWSICDKMRSVLEELKYEAQLSLRFMQNARDTYSLEMLRIADKGKKGMKADEGKTFKTTMDSFLSTFTPVQQQNIQTKIRYDELIRDFEYREFPTTKKVF